MGYLLVEDEDDTAFREVMRARGRMLIGGTSYTDFKRALDGSEVQYESITDNGDATITITVTRQTEKNRIQDLINRNSLPVPAGVAVIITTSVSTGDNVFWGTVTDDSDLSGFIAAADAIAYDHDLQRLQMPTFNGMAYLVFAQRSTDARVDSITIGGLNQTSAFTLRPAAITENGVDYDVWITGRKIIGSKVAGHAVEIRR